MLIIKNVKLKSKTNPPGHRAYIERVYDVQKTPEVLCKMGDLKGFSKFTRKHLCQSLFFNQVAGSGLEPY